MPRYIKIAGVVVASALFGVAVVAWRVGRSGSSPLENWIGSQLQAIANGYINPQLSFSDLDYEYPGTVNLKNLRLVADDPANPGKSVDILGCQSATVALAEIPQEGKPLVIEKVTLNKPLFAAVAIKPDSNEFVGFSNLMREVSTTEAPKLSEVFRMKLVELIDGRIIYDPRIAGTEPMELDQITTRLDIEPTDQGWYRMKCDISRMPVFAVNIAGKLNLDDFSAGDLALSVSADLGAEKVNHLPPQLQQLIRKLEVKGKLSLTVTGDVPIVDPLKGSIQTKLKLADANVTLGEYRVPVDRMELTAQLKEGKALLPSLRIIALMGEMNITGSCVLNDKLDADVNVHAVDMLLEELLAHPKKGSPLPLAGRIDIDTKLAVPVQVLVEKLTRQAGQTATPLALLDLPRAWGDGTVKLVDGKLLPMPIVQTLTSAIGVGGNSSKPEEQVDLVFDFSGDKVVFSKIEYNGDVIAVRGKGSVTLDQKLDLVFNGGPLEKMQSVMGKEVGGIFGAVTDKMARYVVTGNVGDPRVQVIVAGSDIGKATKGAAKKAESAIDKILKPFDK